MAIYTDDLGRSVALPARPQRIVSLVPSQTELLYHLGLEEEVVGITKFCIHPKQWHRAKTRVGGTKNVNIQKVASLQPHLVIANKEENVQEQIETLANDLPVWVSDVNTLEQALQMIQSIGNITGRTEKAAHIIGTIQKGFETFSAPAKAPTVLYLIWQNPYMTIGGDTFISNMLQIAGFTNLYAQAQRYPVVTEEELKALQPDFIFLSSEPYPFGEKHIKDFKAILPHTKTILVDGEMFSWYGSRLQQAPAYFAQLQQQIKSL